MLPLQLWGLAVLEQLLLGIAVDSPCRAPAEWCSGKQTHAVIAVQVLVPGECRPCHGNTRPLEAGGWCLCLVVVQLGMWGVKLWEGQGVPEEGLSSRGLLLCWE